MFPRQLIVILGLSLLMISIAYASLTESEDNEDAIKFLQQLDRYYSFAGRPRLTRSEVQRCRRLRKPARRDPKLAMMMKRAWNHRTSRGRYVFSSCTLSTSYTPTIRDQDLENEHLETSNGKGIIRTKCYVLKTSYLFPAGDEACIHCPSRQLKMDESKRRSSNNYAPQK